jgi:hypothetical protein
MEDIIHHRKAIPFIAIVFRTGLDANGNTRQITKVLTTEDGSFVTFTEDLAGFLRAQKDLSFRERLTVIARRQEIKINRTEFRNMLKFKA